MSGEPQSDLLKDYKQAVELGTRAATSLHMLLRNMRMYDPENAIFVEPIETLRSVMEEVVRRDGRFQLQVIGTVLGINGVAIRVDFGVLQTLRSLTEMLKARGLGGIEVDRALDTHELRAFLRDLNEADAESDPGKLSNVVGVRAARWADIRAELDAKTDQEIDTSRKIDRDKYALTVAARAMTWMKRLFFAIDTGDGLPPLTALNGVLRDLVDLARQRPRQLLRLSSARSIDDALVYHAVNTCLLSLVLGSKLGFERDQLHDLGRAALLHEAGMLGPDRVLLLQQGGLSDLDKKKVERAPLASARIALRLRPLDLSSLRTMTMIKEVRDPVAPPGSEGNPSPLARVLRAASMFDSLTSKLPNREPYPPGLALDLMQKQLGAWFDQDVVAELRALVDTAAPTEPASPPAG